MLLRQATSQRHSMLPCNDPRFLNMGSLPGVRRSGDRSALMALRPRLPVSFSGPGGVCCKNACLIFDVSLRITVQYYSASHSSSGRASCADVSVASRVYWMSSGRPASTQSLCVRSVSPELKITSAPKMPRSRATYANTW